MFLIQGSELEPPTVVYPETILVFLKENTFTIINLLRLFILDVLIKEFIL